MQRILASLIMLAVVPLGSVAVAAPADPATRYVQQFLDAYDHVHSFSGRVGVVSRTHGKVIRQTFQMAIEKPNRTAMTLLEDSAQPAGKGTKIVWFGGPTCTVSTHFFGLPVVLSPKYDDPRLCGPRGDNMRELSVVTAVAVTRNPATRFKLLREDRYLDRPMHVLEIRSPALLKGIDHEVLWLDAALHLPFQRDLVQAGVIAYHVGVETFQFDQRLPADAFQAK